MRANCIAQEHNTKSRPGLEPGPLHPESSALTKVLMDKVLMDSIQVLQSRAAKLVLDRSPYSSSSEALSDLNWMNLSVRRQMQRCIHMYNLVNDNSRNNIIVRGQDYHSYNTRSKEIIRTTKSVTNWGLLRSFNSVLADWNDLSPTTKKLSLRDFKNTLRKTFM